MNIELREIDRSNYEKCIDLKVGINQKNYVATNMKSLVQAAYEPDLYPLGIYNNNEMIGFILYDFDKEINGWSMSRLMIDSKQQAKGYGKEALKTFLSFFKAKIGNKTLYTSAEIENTNAIKLYESFGFKRQEIFEYEVNGVKYSETRMMLIF
jgi:diamine N-acetyltransferase